MPNSLDNLGLIFQENQLVHARVQITFNAPITFLKMLLSLCDIMASWLES